MHYINLRLTYLLTYLLTDDKIQCVTLLLCGLDQALHRTLV